MNHSNSIHPQHSYPFRSFSPNYNPTNTMSYSGGAISPSSSSSSESNHNNNNVTVNDVKTSFSSMKISRKDEN